MRKMFRKPCRASNHPPMSVGQVRSRVPSQGRQAGYRDIYRILAREDCAYDIRGLL